MKKNYILGIIIIFLMQFNATKVQALIFNLKAGGNITTPGDWGTSANGLSGTIPTGFSGSHVWNLGTNNTALTISSNWTVSSTGTVNVGDGTVGFNFIVAANITIGTGGSQPRINFNNASTLTLNSTDNFNNAANKTVFLVGSTVVYGAGSDNNIKASYGDNYYNLQIDVSRSLLGSAITLDGDLKLNAPFDLAGGTVDILGNLSLGADLTLSQGGITLAGTISGPGSIDGDSGGSSLGFTGTGNIGTLKLLSPFTISNLDINLGSATSSISLSNNLIIDGGMLTTNAGILNLNANNLTIAAGGGVDFSGGGTILGTSSSNIQLIATAGGITGNLNMNSGGNTLGGLTINNASGLTLGSTLNITDSVLVSAGALTTGGNLTLKSTGTLAARIASLGATGSVSGNVTIESFFPSGSSGWAMMGTNGVTGQTIANLDGQIPMTCQGCTYGVSLGNQYFESVQGWKETICDFDTTITSGTALTPGKGFWIYLGTSPSTSGNMSWTLTGPVQQGPLSVNCTSGFACTGSTLSPTPVDGSNLLANPYPSPISWEKLWNFSGNSGNFDQTVSYYFRNGPPYYADYNAVSHAGANGGGDVIPAGEGFIVTAAVNASLDFDESVKTPTNTVSLYKQAAKASNVNLMRLHVSGQYDTDEAVFVLHPLASINYDKYDSRKRFVTPGYSGKGGYSHYTSISSQEPTGKFLSINGFAPTNYSLTIPILVRVSISGNYTINADDFQNYGSCIVLRDKLNNSYHDLKVAPYSFYINDTTSTPRFELVVCESGGGAVSVKEMYASSNISIGQDANGPVVKTNFPNQTDAVISVYNLLGQQLTADIKVNGTETTTHLNNLNLHRQVVLIKVTADNQSVTKKLVVE